MMYILAILIPPLATLIYGRWVATIFCTLFLVAAPILGIWLWLIAALIAMIAINNEKHRRFIKEEIDNLKKDPAYLSKKNRKYMNDSYNEYKAEQSKRGVYADKMDDSHRVLHEDRLVGGIDRWTDEKKVH